jgi:hypothetical protein
LILLREKPFYETRSGHTNRSYAWHCTCSRVYTYCGRGRTFLTRKKTTYCVHPSLGASSVKRASKQCAFHASAATLTVLFQTVPQHRCLSMRIRLVLPPEHGRARAVRYFRDHSEARRARRIRRARKTIKEQRTFKNIT